MRRATLILLVVAFVVMVPATRVSAQTTEACSVDGDADFTIVVDAPSQQTPGTLTIAAPGEFGALTLHTPVELVARSGNSGEFDVSGTFDAEVGGTTYTWQIDASLLNTIGGDWDFDATLVAPAGATGSLRLEGDVAVAEPDGTFRITGTVTGTVAPCRGSLADTGFSPALLGLGVATVFAGIVLRGLGRNRCASR